MNRRQFTQSLAALFAAPAMPSISLAAPAQTTLPSAAYFWADYLTRMHNRCTAEMLAPFFRATPEAAKIMHSQLVAENILTQNGYAHPKLLARQPAKTFGQKASSTAQSQAKTPHKSKRNLSMNTSLQIRKAVPEDHQALSDIWHQGWIEAHAAYVPKELVEQRTKESFDTRLTDMLATTFVAGPIGAPIGFCSIKNNEIYQMFVGQNARGTGAAAALISAGCDAISAAGYTEATLDVIPENPRARAFYEKMGWQNQGLQTVSLDTLNDPFELDCIIMTKQLG